MSDPVASLASLLSVAAGRDPDGPAIRDGGLTTTWSDAATRSGQMATALLQAGVKPGDRVGVHYRKSPESFLAMHAVVQQGAIAVPLDPTASVSYLTSVVRQSGCRVVLTHAPCQRSAAGLSASGEVDTFIGIPGSVVESPSSNNTIDQPEIDQLDPSTPVDVDAEQPAYIITTSGSTGRPKGICHSHRSALAYVRFKLEALDLRPSDRISDIAPNHFDISTLALWVTPAVGATNIIIGDQYQMFPASLSKLMASEQVSVWYSVPYLLTELLDRGGLREVDLSSLRWVLFGGEVFPPQALSNLMSIVPQARFSNVYGPAEVNACTMHHLPEAPNPNSSIPIGHPYTDTRIRVVHTEPDVLGQAVEDGEQGEIWVSSPTMMLGYWQQPELTSRSIVSGSPDATSESTAVGSKKATDERWYRTGDLGWYDTNGDLVFDGRLDHQVKVRGHRVELEAIEAVLEGTSEVSNAIATVARTANGADVVIAGLIPAPGVTTDVGQLQTYAREHLPSYAVPTAFYPIANRPITGSGKLDRRSLRSALLQQHNSQKDQAIV